MASIRAVSSNFAGLLVKQLTLVEDLWGRERYGRAVGGREAVKLSKTAGLDFTFGWKGSAWLLYLSKQKLRKNNRENGVRFVNLGHNLKKNFDIYWILVIQNQSIIFLKLKQNYLWFLWAKYIVKFEIIDKKSNKKSDLSWICLLDKNIRKNTSNRKSRISDQIWSRNQTRCWGPYRPF